MFLGPLGGLDGRPRLCRFRGVSVLKNLRNWLFGVNAMNERFDILQGKVDAINAAEGLVVEGAVTGVKAEPALERDPDSESRIRVPERSIRVAFIVQHPSVWPSLRSVWRAAEKNPRFNVKVVIAPFVHPFSSSAVVLDEMRSTLLREGVAFCNAEFFDLAAFRPDVVFVQNPYEETRPVELRLERLREAGARIAYVPYGLELGGGAWNITAQFDTPVHRHAWRIFARSERHKRMFGKYCRAGNHHVVVTGHPKFDSRVSDCGERLSSLLRQKVKGRPVILWTPHFSVGDPPTWSTFRLYGDFILDEISRNPGLFLLLRPHPLFFKAMTQGGFWSDEDCEAFRERVQGCDNVALDETADYHEAFGLSSALMTDVGSFLLEYLPTEKPLLYLNHPAGLGMNDDAKLIDHLYTASDERAVGAFIGMIAREEDPGRAGRLAAIPSFLHGLDGNIGEAICLCILEAVPQEGDGVAGVLQDNVEGKALVTEDFWRALTSTDAVAAARAPELESAVDDLLATRRHFMRAIDLGCGNGHLSLQLVARADSLYGYDISPVMVSLATTLFAEKGCTRASFQVQNVLTLAPFLKFDLIGCFNLLSAIEDDRSLVAVLDRMAMLATHGACLLVSDRFVEANDSACMDEYSCNWKFRLASDLCRLLANRGFVLKEQRTLPDSSADLIERLLCFEFEGGQSQGVSSFPVPIEG